MSQKAQKSFSNMKKMEKFIRAKIMNYFSESPQHKVGTTK